MHRGLATSSGAALRPEGSTIGSPWLRLPELAELVPCKPQIGLNRTAACTPPLTVGQERALKATPTMNSFPQLQTLRA